MWQYYQPSPSTFARREVDEPDASSLDEGEVLLRFLAGAICGSDIPKFLGNLVSSEDDVGKPGAPLHEIVGVVEASRSGSLKPGRRVVGIVEGSRGLSEIIRNPSDMLIPVDVRLGNESATMIQPLATVISTFAHVHQVEGASVAVFGLGPLGLLFTHVARTLGATEVYGIDRVDRSDVSDEFGIDELIHDDVRVWADRIHGAREFDIVVDAIGHKQELVLDAVKLLRDGGQLILFGLPEDHYVFPMRQFFRKNLSMFAGTTRDWQSYLTKAQNYLLEFSELPDVYITSIDRLDRVEEAFCSFAHPKKGQIKAVLNPPEDI